MSTEHSWPDRSEVPARPPAEPGMTRATLEHHLSQYPGTCAGAPLWIRSRIELTDGCGRPPAKAVQAVC